MLDLIGQLRLLTVDNATVARQVGLVNVDSFVVNGPIVIATGTPPSDGRYNASYCDSRTIQDKGSAIINLDDKKQSTPASRNSENADLRTPLPVRFGTYIRFEDPKWWMEAPEFLDIAKALRVISITRRRHSVPSIDAGTDRTRRIMINCESNAMVISRGVAGSPNLHFKNVHPHGRLRAHFQAPDQAKWSLCRIRANEVTDLDLNSCNAVIYYSQGFAECVWLLVQHHRHRGDEAYILVRKQELADD